MEKYILLAIGSVAVISLGIGYWDARKSSDTLAAYYLGDKRLKAKDLGHLLGASSMSLNGIFYHAWLGYNVGIYSLVIQLFWVASFLIFWRKLGNFLLLSKEDSLAGNLRRQYGPLASKVSVFALCLSMIILVGWEVSIAATLAADTYQLSISDSIWLAFSLLVFATLYTVRGGMYANRRANIFQNWLKLATFLALIVLSISAITEPSTFLSPLGASEEGTTDYFKLSPSDAAIALGGIAALMCNLLFSLFWQQADASAWQTFSAGSQDGTSNEREAKRSLRWSMLRVLIFPGLAGTLFGMSLAPVPSLGENDIFPTMFQMFSLLENHVGLAVAALSAFLVAAMLSTMDGLMLSVSYMLNRDFFHTKSFSHFMQIEGTDRTDLELAEERSIIGLGKFLVIVAALFSMPIVLLVQFEKVTLFETVYLAVVGAMAVAPFALDLLFTKNIDFNKEGTTNVSSLPIFVGLGLGLGLIITGLTITPMAYVSSTPWVGGVPFIILAAPAAFFGSYLSLKIVKSFS